MSRQKARSSAKTLPALRSFRHAGYRWYWFSGLWVTGSQGTQQLAMAWLVLDLTGSVGQLGLVIFMQGVPMAVMSLFGGFLADRYSRRGLLVATQLFTTLNLLTLAFLTMIDQVAVWHLYLSSSGLGLMQALSMPARNALIRSLVGDDDMLNAVALNAMQQNSSRIVWPSLAGGMITLLGVGETLSLSAATSFAGVVCLLPLRGITEDYESLPARSSPVREIVEGVRYTFSTPLVSTVIMAGTSVGLFGLAYMNLAPGFAREELGFNASETGFFMMSMGVGSIVGSAALLVFPIRNPMRVFVLWCLAVALIVFGEAVNPWPIVPFLFMAGFGICNSMLFVSGQTILQVNVPPHMLGRVIGLWSLVGGLGFITPLPIGLIGDAVGLRPTLASCAAVMLAWIVYAGFIRPARRSISREVARPVPAPHEP